MTSQDKDAEKYASGVILKRFDEVSWDEYLFYKKESLTAAGLERLKGATILDFGCGPGSFGLLLGASNHVVGVDIAPEAIYHAARRAKSRHADFEAIVADGEQLCFRPASFDICFSGWALHHFPTFGAIIRQFNELLKPGGLAIIIEPDEDTPGQEISRFFENRMRSWVLESGLDTPNRSTHKRKDYVEALELNGFELLHLFSHYNRERPPIPRDVKGIRRVALNVLIDSRHLLFELSNSLGCGPELFVLAAKRRAPT